jgi:transposase
VFDTMLRDAVQVADPHLVVQLGNRALDECRRRVQNETIGHRGRESDPLYRARRRLVMAAERLTDRGRERLMGLPRAGDPRREVWFAWTRKTSSRQIYDHAVSVGLVAVGQGCGEDGQGGQEAALDGVRDAYQVG